MLLVMLHTQCNLNKTALVGGNIAKTMRLPCVLEFANPEAMMPRMMMPNVHLSDEM